MDSKKEEEPKETIKQDELVDTIINMFPGVEKDIVLGLLDIHGNKTQRVIDTLLMASNAKTGETTSGSRVETDSQISTPLGERKRSSSSPEQQLKDDEMLARCLQAQWSDNNNPDDERLAADLDRMERDERMARKLQNIERQKQINDFYPYHNRRQSGPGTVSQPVPSIPVKNEETETETEPITTQIDRKLTELSQDIKSGFSLFTSKITQAFQSSPSPPPSLAQSSSLPVQTVKKITTPIPSPTQTTTNKTHTPNQTPTQSPTHSPLSTSPIRTPTHQHFEHTSSNFKSLFEIGDQEEKELISSEEEGNWQEDYPLIDKRKERKSEVVLLINTE